MTVSISLDAETESRLQERAREAGVDISELIRRLLNEAARDEAARFDSILDEVFSADDRPLPTNDSTFRRSDIYSDHD